ncbi:MAG: TetR/AcrR family transcriptional regulator [Brachybacterium sp.]|nr:TetR/AcrR family transcriptional regulator [Brachybacterium sp.]
MTPTSAADEAPPTRPLGLREQKKRRARDAMHVAALELVAEHGLTCVTAEMIAERADVSPRTFFNYWGTKDAAVLGLLPEDGRALPQMLRDRPREEDPRVSLRAIVRHLGESVPSEPAVRELRKSVVDREPKLQQTSKGQMMELQAELIEVLQERLPGEDAFERATLYVQLAFAAARSAFAVSMRRGTAPPVEFERIYALIDSGKVGP